MDIENDKQGIRATTYKDVIVTLRVSAIKIPQDIVKAIILNDIDEVSYKVDEVDYEFKVQDITFVESLN
jgi:hypothetical protein|tara:strand:- start:388 stop:594 length:207 start_codon:yes stop_codon:yes gene_type:complete